MMKGICIEIIPSGERRHIESPVWITRNRNGILATPHRHHACGVGDGTEIWSLGGLAEYPAARIITRAEYEETLQSPDPDPELTAEQALEIMMGGSYEAE